jgi:hypothetical protein
MRGKQGRNRRRRSAIDQREAQLKVGTKPEKVGGRTTNKQIPLTENDVKRIKKEIEVLHKRAA